MTALMVYESKPHQRLMVFVDGPNILRESSKELEIDFRADKPPLHALAYAKEIINNIIYKDEILLIRKYWFGSFQGSEEDGQNLRFNLRENGFDPVLFKNIKGKQEKGVDIALTKEMLVNAFHKNFDIGLLIAGDEDYLGLVNEVKRYGPIMRGAFFRHGLAPNLLLEFDDFKYLPKDVSGNKLISYKNKIMAELKKFPNKSVQ